MAILKDLIVHGSSRFLNKIYASEIQTPLIEAETGIFKKLKADDATVVGLLDVKGQLHTNNWSNSNIATIDGSFYITPTIGSDSGTVTITATSLNFSGTNYAVTSLYLGDGSAITWPQYSKVLVTGQILSNGEWIPLGTLLGQLSAQAAAAASIKINNIKDNKNQTSSVLATLVNNGTTSSSYRNLKVSLYQRASSSTAFYPLGIYITATGDNGRTFLDIYGGIESLENNANHGGFAEPNVRIGNLQGLPNVGGQSPNGWGIYTDNGYFKGIIAADRGYIGTGSKYWVIGNYEDGSNSNNDRSYIYNGTNSTTSTIEGVYLGTDGIRNYKDSTHYVTIKNGVISALGVDLSGKITASSGSIGGWNIGTDTNKSLYHGNQTPGATTTNLVLSPTSATNSNAIGGSATGLNWFLSAGKVFGVTTAGALYATSGKIGSWEIGSNYLLTGTWGTGESALLSTGSSSSKKIGGSDLINNWVFTAGANFGVTKSGALYASSANISGKITATSGEIGGITIDNNGKLWITDANISGTISGNHIDASSISIGNLNGASNYAQKTDVTQAIDNIEVGGRNLLKESDCLAPVQISKGITITYNGNGWFNVNGTVTGTAAGILCFYGSSQHTSNISGSGEYTLSIETNGTIFLPSNKTFIQLAYHSDNATDNKIAGDFHILSGSTKVTFTIPENHHISRVCLFIQANATDGVVDGNIRLKLEKGNKVTDWAPAPEDVVNEAVNKVEVGGRNLIRNSTNFNKWVVQNGGANGEIWYRSVSGNTSNVNLRPRTWIGTGNLADYYNKTLVVSFEIMSPDWSAIEEGSSYTGLNGLAIQLETANGIPYSSSIGETGRYFFKRLGDKNYFKTDSDLVDGNWVKITSVPLKIDDTLWNNSTTLIDGYDYFTFSFLLRRNGTISFRKLKIELGNKATDWTPAPEDTQENINNISTVANTALGQSVWYAECSTAAGTAIKVATISPVTTNFVLTKGVTVNIKFTNTNSATNSSLQLNINGTGAKNIKYIYNGSLTNIPKEYLKANQMYQFRYDGTYWVVQMMYNSNNYDRSLYSLSLAASEVIAAGKIAVLGLNNKLIILKSTSFYIDCPPLYVGTTYEQTHVTNANTKTNNYTYWGTSFNLTSTHSIQNATANTNVYIVGTLSGNIFTPNTTVLTCAEPTTENGLYYMLLGRMTSTTNAVLQAEHPIYVFRNGQFQKLEATTATNYITQIDNTGIKIAPYDKSGNDYLQLNSDAISMYRNNIETLRIEDNEVRIGKINDNNVFIDNTSVNIREGQNTLASFGIDGMQIGLNNEIHTEQDYHSWKMIDKDGNIYAFVSDLRDEYGEATVTEIAKLNEATNWAETNFDIDSIVNITVNGNAPDSYQKRSSNFIDIEPEPTDEDVIVVTYTSQSPELKAYTFGKRYPNSNIGGYSFAEGVNNVASDYTSHAEGISNTSSGEASHVEGMLNTAQGRASHAQNFHTTASSDYQTAIGKYNVDDANNQYAFIIGNGGLNRIIHKTDYSNALAIGWNGDMQVGGRMFGTLMENSDPAHELPTRTPIPLFKTVSWNWDNQIIGNNSGWFRGAFNIYQKGYSALGVVGFGVYPATENPANIDQCIIIKCYTWYNPNVIMEDNHVGGDILDVYVWNRHQSQNAKVNIFVKVLYIAESAFLGVSEPGT